MLEETLREQSTEWCLIRDDNCRWYCIPFERKQEFYNWNRSLAEKQSEIEHLEKTHHFTKYLIDSPSDIAFKEFRSVR